MHSRVVLWLLLVVTPSLAQEAGTAPGPVPEAAARYLDILIKRPQPGTIFERFYAAWLEQGTTAELGAYLAARTKEKSVTAADHLLLALYQAHRGDDPAALAAYEAALKLDAANATAWIERSRLESRALDFAAALKSLDAAAKAKPDAAQTMEIGKMRGRALLRSGKNEEALKVWKDLAAAHADDEDLAEELVDLLADEGQYEAAIEAVQALVKQSRDPVARTLRQLRLADILLLAERRDDALKTLREALTATGAGTWIEGDVISRMGRVFRMSDDVSGLEKFVAGAVKDEPQRVSLAWEHTKLLGETGQKDAAMKQARELLQSNPGRRDLQEGFLDLLESLGFLPEAVEQARVLAGQNSGDKELLVRLATLQHRTQDDAGAQQTLERFLSQPGAGEAEHLRVARLLENWEEPRSPAKADAAPGAAAKAYARLVEKFPDSMNAHESQAHYLHRAGQREAALAIWSRLAKSAAIEDLLRITQALQARLETRTALDLLMPREREFAAEARFYALLVQLGIANKEYERTLPWARARLRLAQDAEAIESAIRDVLLVLRGDDSGKAAVALLQELQKHTAPAIQDRCLLAAMFEDNGKSAEAEKRLNEAAAGEQLIVLSQLAHLFQVRQDWEKAALTWKRVIELPEGRTSARVQRVVDCYRRAMRPDEALPWLAEWKKLSPSAVQPWLDESRLLQELNRPKEALARLRDAMRRFPDNLEAATSHATLCQENGLLEEAERTYLMLYEKTTDAAARLRLIGPLALAAQNRNGLPRLLENFQQRQKQNRASAQPWLALAEIHRATGNDEERRRCLYEASRLRPQDLELLHEIARSEEEVGLTAEALRTLEAAAKLDKTSKTREHIARVQIESGDADLGYRLLFELAGGDQMDARAVEQMADAMAERGEWERVVLFLEPLIGKHPRDYRLHYLRAVALEENGRERDAVTAFVALLEMHEELPGVTSAGRSIGLRQQYATMQLPPGTEDWLVLPGMMQLAYGHRQKTGGRGSSYGGYSRWQTASSLPRGFIEQAPGVTESPVLALAHLLQIAGGWDSQDRATLVPRLKQAGVTDAALLLEAAEYSPQLTITTEMLLAHPESALLHAVWQMQYQNGDPEDLQPACESGWKLFQMSNPVLALKFAQRGWALGGDQAAVWFERMATLVETMPAGDADMFQILANMLRYQGGAMEEANTLPKLKPQDIKRLSARLLTWYRARKSIDGYDPAFTAGALILAENWEGAIEVLKGALEPPPEAVPASSRRNRSGFGGASYLQPQRYPFILGVPVRLASLANLFQEGESMAAGQLTQRLDQIRGGLRPFIAQTNDSRLKLLLRILCADYEEVEKENAERLKSKEAGAQDHLLAGWLAQRARKPEAAVTHFAAALTSITVAEDRMAAENALLFHASTFLQQQPDDSKADAMRAQARAVLDSHLKTTQSADEKYQIAQIFGSIGLPEEATAIQEAIQASQQSMRGSRQANVAVVNPYSRNLSYQRQQKTQVTPAQLVKDGKTDLAVKELVRQLRAAVQQSISPQNSISGHQQLHQVIKNATALKLWDDVFKVVRDSADAGWRMRLDHAVVLEHIGNDPAPALAEHQAIIAANPRAFDSHLRLAVLLAYQRKFDEAVRHWRALPAFVQEQQISAIIQEFTQRHEYAVIDPGALAGLLGTWLRGLDPSRPLSTAIVNHLNQVLHYVQQADGTYPSLYQSWQPDPFSEGGQEWKVNADGTLVLDEASARQRALRRQAHDELCRAMLEVPELAQSAFPPYAALIVQDGNAAAIEQLEATALDLLKRLSLPKVRRRLANVTNPYGNSSRHGSQQIPMLDAAQFLMKRAALRNDVSAINDRLMPLITQVNGRPRAAYLKGWADLLMATEADFATTAEKWLKQQRTGASFVLDEALRLWHERKIATPIDALVLAGSTRGPATMSDPFGSSHSLSQAMTSYALALGTRGADQQREFVRKVRDRMLGSDAAARKEVLKAWREEQQRQRSNRFGYYAQPNPAVQKAGSYSQWLQNLLQKPGGLAVLEIALEDGFDSSPGWLRQIAYQHINDRSGRTAEGFIAVAEAAGFLGDAKTFRTYDLGENEGHASWLGNLVRQFREQNDDEQVNAALAQIARRKATFGSDLTQALLVKNSRTLVQIDGKPLPFEAARVAHFQSEFDQEGLAHRGAALEACFIRHSKELQAMNTIGQQELSGLLREELVGYPEPAHLGQPLAQVLAPLLKTESLDMIRKVDAVLAAKTWGDLGQQEHAFVESFARLLRDVARFDLEKAAAAAAHAVELLRSSPEQKQMQARRENELPTSRFLHTLAQSPVLLPVIFKLAEADGLMDQYLWRYQLRNRLEQVAHHAREAPALFTATPFVAEAGEFIDIEDSDKSEPTLLAHLINAIENNDKCRVVREHLARQPDTFGVELLRAFFHREPGDDAYVRSFYNSKRPNDAPVLAFIRKRGAEFVKLSPRASYCVFALLNARFQGLEAKVAQDPALQAALQPLFHAERSHFEADVTRWMKISDLRGSGHGYHDVIESCERLLDRLAQQDKARAVALLDHVSTLLAQQEVRNNGGQRQPAHQTQVARWLQRASRVPELLSEVRQRAEQSGAASDAKWLTEQMRTSAQISGLRGQPARLVALLEASGMLNAAATFAAGFLPAAEGQQPRTQLELMMTDFHSHPGLAEILQQRQPPTFGSRLVQLLLSSTAEDRAEFARSHAEEIAACPPVQQRLLAEFIERRKWAPEFATNVLALQDEFAPILKEQAGRGQEWLDGLLMAEKWQQIEESYARTLSQNQRSEFDSRMNAGPMFFRAGQTTPVIDHLVTQLAAIAASDVGKALQGFRHVARLHEAEFGNSPSLGERFLLNPLLHKLCSFPRLVPEVLKVAARNWIPVITSGQVPLNEYTLITQALPPSTLSSPAKIVSMLSDLGLLTDASAYDPVILPNYTKRSLLGLVLWRLSNANTDVGEETARLLLADKDAKFGGRLIAALITAADTPAKDERLALCAADFNRVPPQTAGVLLNAFEDQYPELSRAAEAEGDLKLFAPLLETRAREERTYLDMLLAGQNGPEPHRGRTLVVRNETSRLVTKGMREEVVSLLTKLRNRIDSRSQENHFLPRHDHYLTNSLDAMLAINSTDSPAVFAGRMWAAAVLPGVRLTPALRHPQGFPESNHVILMLWEQRGGRAAPGAVFAQLIQEIATHDMSGTAGLWLPVFSDMVMNLGASERGMISAWADKQRLPALQTIAHELKLAVTLVESTSPVFHSSTGARRVIAASPAAARSFRAAGKAAAALLRDEKIASHIRLSLAGYLCGVYPGLLDDETLLTWALAAAQAWHDEKPVTTFELEGLLNAAAVLPVNDTWKRTSTVVLDRWKQREEIFRKARIRSNTRSLYPFVLRFACRSGDEGVLEGFVRDKNAASHDFTRIRSILLECGAWKHAAAMKLDSTEYPDTFHGKWYGWLPPDKAALKAMQDASPEAALDAEVSALCADVDATWVLFPANSSRHGHDERLVLFTKKLAATPLPADVLKRAPALTKLGREHPAAALPLLSQFKAVDKVFLSDSLGENAGANQWADFLAVHAALSIAKNDFVQAESCFKRLKTDPKTNDRFNTYNPVEARFRETLEECLLRLWSGGLARDPEKLLAFSPYKDVGNYSSSSKAFTPRAFQSCLASWASALKQGPLPDKTDAPINKLSSSGQPEHFALFLAAMGGTGKERLSFQQRLQLFEGVSRQTLVTTARPRVFSLLLHHGLFTADELVRNAATLQQRAASFPPGYAEDLADLLLREDAPESASAMLAEAAALWGGESQSPSVPSADRCLAERAALLIRLQDFDEARRCLNQMRLASTTSGSAAHHDALLKMLPPAPARAK
ncbi:MAG: hypothetical protein IAE77_10390 [Prosthecobacter sp.]|jgi:tetratricopeptide (TPR) repeat protein|uniref:tetratricopeptide repeat protein n=1 Tax=Prosthecobacter sp. TaxID=1965333 RepID=UPI001A104189|nr:hypothetical protein [Prosthecobacter sp.]MBE2283853.1 hypothetical protein [Prosthecobacter sp.]